MEENRAFRKAKTEHFARQNHQFGRVCQNLAGCAKIWQGVPKFHRVCENHFMRINLLDFSPELYFFLFTPFVIDK